MHGSAGVGIQYGHGYEVSSALWRMLEQIMAWRSTARENPPSRSTLRCAQVHQGLHWVCAMIDMQNQKLVYYDSLKVRLVAFDAGKLLAVTKEGGLDSTQSALCKLVHCGLLGGLRATLVCLGAWQGPSHLCASFRRAVRHVFNPLPCLLLSG